MSALTLRAAEDRLPRRACLAIQFIAALTLWALILLGIGMVLR